MSQDLGAFSKATGRLSHHVGQHSRDLANIKSQKQK
jgi:hypothetical protein